MQPYVIFNPAAGHGAAARLWPQIVRELRGAIGDFELAETAHSDHARGLAREAAAVGPRLIVAVGGDGTISQAVDGLAGRNGAAAGVSFGFVAIGTGNDFRRSLGASGDFRADIARLAGGGERLLDLGRLTFAASGGASALRHFVNVASFGLSGATVCALDRARLPRLLGPTFLFFYGSVSTMLAYRFRKVRLVVDNTFNETCRIAVVAVALGSHFGAGMKVAPDASMDDGLFEIVIVRGDNKARLIACMPTLYDGTHVTNRAVTILRGRHVSATPVDVEDEILLEADGETSGRLPASFEILPGALRLRG
jgi:YegS/Rv2252/BmrU family lipid kinase